MNPTLNEKFLAYLALFSGITLSIVAEYYSILGLTSIFSAAVIPVIIMGIVLGIGKVSATLWLKQNWAIAPWTIRVYLISAITVLMLITSLGVFGFLSKAHSDQSLVSGDVQSKIAIYDEKIKTARENIDANRTALKQMDEAVDQIMGRSQDEKGADKAVGLRRSQQKERVRLQSEIAAEQKTIASLNEERAPIAADVRKVEAEVGPIKYIAQFVYGDNPDANILEKAVTWVIIILIVVFDPLAVILLLASQISFQNFRDRKVVSESVELGPNEYVPDPEEEAFHQKLNSKTTTEGDSPEKESDVVSTATVTESILAQHPYLSEPFVSFKDLKPMVYKAEGDSPRGTTDVVDSEPPTVTKSVVYKPETSEEKDWKRWVENGEIPDVERPGDYLIEPDRRVPENYVQNEEQQESGRWNSITQEEYLKAVKQRQQPKE